MGQTSSQPNDQPNVEPDMELSEKSDHKRRKSTKHKNTAVKMEQTTYQMEKEGEETGAHQETEVAESKDLPFENDDVLELQQWSSSKRSKKHIKHDKKKKREKRIRDGADTDTFSGNGKADGELERTHLPSTPPNQAESSSPPPTRLSTSRSPHVLDEIPTDDETAIFDKEFGSGIVSAEPLTPKNELYSFSQQPPEDLSQQGSTYPTYQLPVPIDNSEKISKKNKKRKRYSDPAPATTHNEPMIWGDGAGSPPFDFDSGFDFENQPFDNLFDNEFSFANPLSITEDLEVPIDPELHSTSALPPAVDLSTLGDPIVNTEQSRSRKHDLNRSSKPVKRRRMETDQPVLHELNSYHSPYNDQEETKKRALPESEDMRKGSEPEFGTPVMAMDKKQDVVGNQNAAAKSKKSSQQEQWESKSMSDAQLEGQKGDIQPTLSVKAIAVKGGQWKDDEIVKLDRFRDQYCEANRSSHEQFNNLIQSNIRNNPKVSALFNELHEVVPYRPRPSLQKLVRRRFHNYSARGTWSAEEDEMLKQAVQIKGTSWKAVGEMIDRMAEDCRDRWRNYLVNSEHRNHEQWTDDEVRDLCNAIIECIQLMRAERRQALEDKYGLGAPEVDEDSKPEEDDLHLINWQAVSDRMGKHGGGRSRLQCSLKWTQLKKTEHEKLLESIRQSQGFAPTTKAAPKKNTWRHVRNAKMAANMKAGDRYALLQAMLNSHALTEANIPWKALGDEDFRITWSSSVKKIAWENMKTTITAVDSKDYREIANHLIMRLVREEDEDINHRWDPAMDGNLPRTKMSRQVNDHPTSKRRESQPKDGMKRLSKEFVRESDDEDADDATDSSKDYNQLDINGELGKTASEDEEEANGNEKPQESDEDSLFDGPLEEDEDAP
ncbi:hypothetical protein ACLMJK_000341 [Lecanora helva]